MPRARIHVHSLFESRDFGDVGVPENNLFEIASGQKHTGMLPEISGHPRVDAVVCVGTGDMPCESGAKISRDDALVEPHG